MAPRPPAKRPPSPLVLVILAALVVVGIFVLKAATESAPVPAPAASTPEAPTTGSGGEPAEAPSAASTTQRPRPARPDPDRAPAGRPVEAPGDEEGAPRPIEGGAGLPAVRGMDAPPAEAEPPEGAGEGSAAGPVDEDGERLVYAPDRQGIRAAIGGEVEHLKDCYAAWLEADPSIGGTVKVQFVISDPDAADDEALARISAVKILGTTLTGEGAQFIEGCVMNVMSSLRFDPPEDGKLVVNYPFIFSSEPRAEGDDAP